jgi:class 3 adenylate cyclase
MGLHTGTPYLGDEGYVGSDVNLGARIAASGHGGQILISKATRELIADHIEDLGRRLAKDPKHRMDVRLRVHRRQPT